MAGVINVSGVFIFTVSASNAIYNEVTCNLAAIKISAYNVQDQPAVFNFTKVDGDSKTALTAYPALTVYNKSGSILVEQKPAAGTSISYTIPVTDLATADRVIVRIYSDVERTNLLAESASISIVRENPIPFPRGEVWASDMVFKNGEMLLLDSIAYMWSSPVSGNSALDPKTDIANNPTTTCWIGYQNWPLLCTNMMIARLGLIGKAVFYDEYMFSQHGTDLAGTPTTNYDGFKDGKFTPNILLDFMRGIGHLAGGNLWWDVFGNSFFKGSIFSLMRQIERPSGTIVYLDFSTGFNIDISGLTNDVSDGPITALLPTASDYNGAECTIWYAHACTRVPHEHPHIGIVNNGGFLNLLFEKKHAIKFVPETLKKIKLSAMPNYDESGVASVRWYVDTPEYVTAIE